MGRPATSAPAALVLSHFPGQLLTAGDLEGERWHDCFPTWPASGVGGPRATPEHWLEIAQTALSAATRTYEKRVGGGPAALNKEQTIGDRIASVTLRVQESPLHRLEDLRMLLSVARKKGRRESAPAVEALKDLFVHDLLPSDRRLVRFEDREFDSEKGALSKRHLAYALFEGELKALYREFLEVLEESGRDALAHFKQKAVKIVAELLVAKPECEKELLSMLVNKLGDPDRKVSSTASYCLQQLIEKHHPQMRLVVVREVEQLLIRPNVTQKAQYFAVSFLNQIRFTNEDVELARRLLRIYMDMFTTCLSIEKQTGKSVIPEKSKFKAKARWKRAGRKKPALRTNDVPSEAKESRLMGALLIGANRAYPYSKPEQDETSYQRHYDALFEVAHAKALGPATQAFAFLFQVSQSHATQSDRFYRALYSRIIDAAEVGEPKQAQFLNLLYKAMTADTNPRRIKAYVKRLLQAALSGTPAFAGACSMVVSECFKGRQLGALKSFISVAGGADEVEHFFDADKTGIPETNIAEGEESGEGGSKAGDDNFAPLTRKESHAKDGRNSGSERRNREEGTSQDGPHAQRYDPGKRDPQYAGAERSSLWELVSLCSHFHPSVSMFAKSMCVHLKNVEYPGDPLKDLSVIAFLDKFVYKKPKNRVAKSLYGKRSARYRDDPVPNSQEFQELAKAGNVGEDDKFFVRFFEANPSRILQPKTEDGEARREDDAAELGADSEEEAFEQAMQAEMRRLGADPGFSSRGINDTIADVDEQDEDELKAFEKAFENEMVESDDEEKESVAAVLQKFKNSEDDGSDDDNIEDARRETKKKKKTGTESVFAAADDYAEAIQEDATRVLAEEAEGHEDAKDVEDAEEPTEHVEEPNVTARLKRKTLATKPTRPKKKRRLKKG